MRSRTAHTLVILAAVLVSGCFPTVYLPQVAFDRIEIPLRPADPIFSGPGSSGPIWGTPEITNVGNCCPSDPCDPCSGCNPPGHPLQPIDPFGWLRSGTAGSQFIDPVGWVFGL